MEWTISMFTMSSNSISAENIAFSELMESKEIISDTVKFSILNTMVQRVLLKYLNEQITALMKTVMAKEIKFVQKTSDWSHI